MRLSQDGFLTACVDSPVGSYENGRAALEEATAAAAATGGGDGGFLEVAAMAEGVDTTGDAAGALDKGLWVLFEVEKLYALGLVKPKRRLWYEMEEEDRATVFIKALLEAMVS